MAEDNPAVTAKADKPAVIDGSVKNQPIAPIFAANNAAFKV